MVCECAWPGGDGAGWIMPWTLDAWVPVQRTGDAMLLFSHRQPASCIPVQSLCSRVSHPAPAVFSSATRNQLDVIIDEGNVDSPTAHRTPQRGGVSSTMMANLSPHGMVTPYSGSVAGSTSKHARRRNLREHHDEDSREHDTDGGPLDRSGSIGTAERLGSKYEKMMRQQAGQGGGGDGGGGTRKRRSRALRILLAAIVALLVSVFFFVSSETITMDALLSRSAERRAATLFYDPSIHRDEYEHLMAAASTPKTGYNARRACLSSDTYAEGNAAAEKLPDLIEIHAWKSRKPVEGNSISLVTHLSVDRLESLEQQCLVWPDKIVAAIYVPMTANVSGGLPLLPSYSSTTLDDMIRGIGSFHVYMEKTAVCSLDLIFLGQFINKPDVPGAYPTNALRNKALSLVTTELNLHVNVDVVMNPYLDAPGSGPHGGSGYKDPEVYSELVIAAKKNTAFVMPVLEVASQGQDLRIVRSISRSQALAGKRSAKDFISKGVLVPFVAPEDAEKRVWSVNVNQWMSTSPKDGHMLVKIDKGAPPVSSLSEPCVLLATEKTPWFDERFVDNGPGANIWTAVLEKEKYKFRVHSSGFGVHMSHERATPKSRYLQRRKEFRLEVMQFLNSTLHGDISKGKYKPMTRDCGRFPKVALADRDDALDLGVE